MFPVVVYLSPWAPLRDLFYLVIGWGYNGNQCDTNDNGPNPNTQCKFPFMYNGELQRECVKTSTPAAENLICTELFNWAKVCFIYTYSGGLTSLPCWHSFHSRVLRQVFFNNNTYNRNLRVGVNETHWRNKVFGARQSSRTWLNPLHIKYTTGIIRKKSQSTQHVTVQSLQHKAGAELALKRIYQDKKVFATNLALIENLGWFHLQSIL